MKQAGKAVVVLFGAVYDLTPFLLNHPGGKDVLLAYSGQDATEKFVQTGHLSKGRIYQTLAKHRVGKHAP